MAKEKPELALHLFQKPIKASSFMPKSKSSASDTEPVPVIAFDFDGTITTKDTFALFLRYWAGTPKWAFKILGLLPIFLLYVFKIIDRNQVKIHVVRAFFKGADSAKLNAKAEQFAKTVIPNYVRPQALKELQSKLESEAFVMIVSASITPYLDSWGKAHGVRHIVATNLAKMNGRLTGELDGPNCWGAGKLVKIQSYMGQTPYIIEESYGDSRGDREMLHAARVSHFKPFRL